MKELLKKMEQQRQRRQNRRANGKTCTKRNDDVTVEKEYAKSPITVVHKQSGNEILDSASTAAVDGENVEVCYLCY